MKSDTSQFEKFKELLDQEHSWPSEYQFKFIVKHSELENVRALFREETIAIRESESGKYVSLTFSKVMRSSDEVISIYKKASIIPGLMAL
jgi:hypothetical protein